VSAPERNELAARLLAGERAALAKAITLTESSRPEHRDQANELLDEVLEATGHSQRIGISGTPGVGKSTFIEAFGLNLLSQGRRVAVLAVDPSSQTTGGSILGDKTRMLELNRSDRAFIRPSPSRGRLGGVTVRSRDAVLLCEAAGYDTVLVETVGVGQSETAVAQVTDLFLLLIGPGGGDDLQGIKRGVMELADLIVVNKADGARVAEAQQTADSYRNALHLVRPKWDAPTEVMTCSALDTASVSAVSTQVLGTWERLANNQSIERLRSLQAEKAMTAAINEMVLATLHGRPGYAEAVADLQLQVSGGRQSASSAAAELTRQFLSP
jgi:LAO/AO transport system kinase